MITAAPTSPRSTKVPKAACLTLRDVTSGGSARTQGEVQCLFRPVVAAEVEGSRWPALNIAPKNFEKERDGRPAALDRDLVQDAQDAGRDYCIERDAAVEAGIPSRVNSL